jgi:hypothetical protein
MVIYRILNKDKLQPVVMNALFNSGEIKPNPIHLVEGSSFLERSENALKIMREGRVSGQKLIVCVADQEA